LIPKAAIALVALQEAELMTGIISENCRKAGLNFIPLIFTTAGSVHIKSLKALHFIADARSRKDSLKYLVKIVMKLGVHLEEKL
jgi:hypothetical protein